MTAKPPRGARAVAQPPQGTARSERQAPDALAAAGGGDGRPAEARPEGEAPRGGRRAGRAEPRGGRGGPRGCAGRSGGDTVVWDPPGIRLRKECGGNGMFEE